MLSRVQNVIDNALAGDILYLTSAEVKFVGQYQRISFLQVRKHGHPDVLALFGRWLLELNFVEEAAVEGIVQRAGQIGRGYHDSLKIFHFLQDDVLHGVFHLIHRIKTAFVTAVQQSIRFIEQ